MWQKKRIKQRENINKTNKYIQVTINNAGPIKNMGNLSALEG